MKPSPSIAVELLESRIEEIQYETEWRNNAYRLKTEIQILQSQHKSLDSEDIYFFLNDPAPFSLDAPAESVDLELKFMIGEPYATGVPLHSEALAALVLSEAEATWGYLCFYLVKESPAERLARFEVQKPAAVRALEARARYFEKLAADIRNLTAGAIARAEADANG